MKLNLISLPSRGKRQVKTLDGSFMEDDYPVTDREFGKRLRETREMSGLMLSQAAKLLGITTIQMSNLEIGKRYELSDEEKENAIWVIKGVIK